MQFQINGKGGGLQIQGSACIWSTLTAAPPSQGLTGRLSCWSHPGLTEQLCVPGAA